MDVFLISASNHIFLYLSTTGWAKLESQLDAKYWIILHDCWCMKVYVKIKRAELPTALLDPRRRNNNKNRFFA